MKKNIKGIFLSLFLLFPILLIACSSTAEPAAKQEEVMEEVQPVQETAVPDPTATPTETPSPIEEVVEDEPLPVMAKPQLIEFYADW